MKIKQEVKEIIKLNKIEQISMIKEYLIIYLQSFLYETKNNENRQIILTHLKEYLKTIQTENFYMSKILENVVSVQNKDLNEVLDLIDICHEQTYYYYEKILSEYKQNLEMNRLDRKITPKREFKTILERYDYQDMILGLSLTNKDLDTYYKKEDAYFYLKGKTKILNNDIEKLMSFYGCYLIEEEGILKDIKICVPKITNLKSMLINIHEYKHGICLYPYIGEKIPIDDYESIARYEEEKFKEKYLRKIKK